MHFRLSFGSLLLATSLIAILVGFALTCWRGVERKHAAEQANTSLQLWGGSAKLYYAEHGFWPSLELDPTESRPNWKEVSMRPQAWYNCLPKYQNLESLAKLRPEATQLSTLLERDNRKPFTPLPSRFTRLHLAPQADYSEPERWQKRPIFAYAYNQNLIQDSTNTPNSSNTSPTSAITPDSAQVLFFETLTHRNDAPHFSRMNLSDIGHNVAKEDRAADRYRLGTAAVLTDGSVIRKNAAELPW